MRNWVWNREEIVEKSNEGIVAAGAEMKRGYGEEYWCLPGQKLYCLHFTSALLTANQVCNTEGVCRPSWGCAPRVLCISGDKQKAVFFEMLKMIFSFSRKKTLSANFSFSLHPADFEQWWYSDYCLTPTALSCGIQRSQNPLSLSPFSPVKENETKTPISQAIRLLFCVLYSSSDTNSLFFPLPIFYLPFTCSFWRGGFTSGIALCIKSHVGDIHWNVFFLLTEII